MTTAPGRQAGRSTPPAWRRSAYRLKVALWRVRHRPAGRSVADVLRAELGRARRSRRSSLPRVATVSPAVLLGIQQAKRSLADGEVDDALTTLLELEDKAGDDRGYWRVRRQVHVRRGEMTEALQAALRGAAPGDDLRSDGLVGRLLETDPGWAPAFATRTRPVEPAERVPQRVLHVLKESVPLRENGFTMRSHGNLVASRGSGWDPVVVTALGFPRLHVGDEPFEPVEVVDGIEHHRLDLGPGYRLDGPLQDYLRDFAWLAARKARELRPELLHVGSGHRGYETALVGREVARSTGIPWVYEVRSYFESTWTPDWQRAVGTEYFRRRRDTETRCMLAADAVVTICRTMRDDIVERGVDPRKVFVVPNGVDVDRFVPAPRDEALAERTGLVGCRVFGYVSNLDHPREAQELLVEALAVLRDRGVDDVRCLLVGKGPRTEVVLERARALGVEDRLVLTGAVPHEQVPDYYRLFDVFVVPRVDEWAARHVTPLKPFEAAAVEVPLLVSDLPALREIVEEPERGRTFRTGDAADLARVVGEMLDDPAAQRPAVERARAWVEGSRRWAHNGPRLAAVYDHVLHGGPDATEVERA